MNPVIAIVGKPNVGKSTLFNRLLGRRQAIVKNTPGVTRDRHYGWLTVEDKEFMLIDSGGLVASPENSISEHVNAQVALAVEEADLVWVLLESHRGATAADEHVIDLVRRTRKPFLLVCNKIDRDQEYNISDAYRFGLDLFPLSAMDGTGVQALLDDLAARYPDAAKKEDASKKSLKIAIVGRPNVGKSSIVNRLLGQERMVVDSKPGTTRDSVDTHVRAHGMDIVLLDTAGIRRHAKREGEIESLAAMLVERRLKGADLAWLVIDMSVGITDQDKRVAAMVERRGLPMILVANKWDLLTPERKEEVADALPKAWAFEMQGQDCIPVFTVSAETGLRVKSLLDKSVELKKNPLPELDDEILDNWLDRITLRREPPMEGTRPVILRGMTQVRVTPPTFIIYANSPKAVSASYRRFLARRFRDQFPTINPYPLRFLFRDRRARPSDHVN